MNLSDRVKDKVSLRDLVERHGVEWNTAKSQPAKGDHWAPCPFHAEITPSFHVVEPAGVGGYYKCFGCGAKGTVIDFVMQTRGLSAVDAMKALADEHGVDREPDPEKEAAWKAKIAKRQADADRRAKAQAESRFKGASLMWKRAHHDDGKIARYLTYRGVNLDAIGGVPASLRIAHALKCWGDGQNKKKEAPLYQGATMVACIGRGQLVGVHRTWITDTGRALMVDGKKVPKKWLGRTGAMYGQPVKFCATSPVMIVGEGIESTLAAWGALIAGGYRDVSAEAALTRGALADGAWVPPDGVQKVIVLAEGSSKPAQKPGDPTGAEQAQAATQAAVNHLEARGLEVQAILPGGRWDQDIDCADIPRELSNQKGS